MIDTTEQALTKKVFGYQKPDTQRVCMTCGASKKKGTKFYWCRRGKFWCNGKGFCMKWDATPMPEDSVKHGEFKLEG